MTSSSQVISNGHPLPHHHAAPRVHRNIPSVQVGPTAHFDLVSVCFVPTSGSTIASVRQIRRMGTDAAVGLVPAGVPLYVTIDIDGFDPSIVCVAQATPPTASPTTGRRSSPGSYRHWNPTTSSIPMLRLATSLMLGSPSSSGSSLVTPTSASVQRVHWFYHGMESP